MNVCPFGIGNVTVLRVLSSCLSLKLTGNDATTETDFTNEIYVIPTKNSHKTDESISF